MTSLLDEGTCGTSSPAASSSFEGTRRTRKAERPRKEAREESARIEGRGNERVRERERSVQRLKNPLHNYSPRRPSCALRGGRVRARLLRSTRAGGREMDGKEEEEKWKKGRVTDLSPRVYRSLRNAATIPSVRSRFSLVDRSWIDW